MIYAVLASLVLIIHAAFVLFVMFGGLLVLRYPKALWWHLPALTWGIIVQWANLMCPLTLLENYFYQLSGAAGYTGGFIEHVISTLLYPENLTPLLRYVLAAALAALNVAIYIYVLMSNDWRVAWSSTTRAK